MFSFFRGISGVVSEDINCKLVIVLDNDRLVSEKIFKLRSSRKPMSISGSMDVLKGQQPH